MQFRSNHNIPLGKGLQRKCTSRRLEQPQDQSCKLTHQCILTEVGKWHCPQPRLTSHIQLFSFLFDDVKLEVFGPTSTRLSQVFGR